MSGLPNIEPVTLLIILFALELPRETPAAITVFILHQQAVKLKPCLWYNIIDSEEGIAEMRVLGIDPGYAIVGWGVVDYAGNRFAPVDFGAVCTDAGVPFEQRLDEVYTGIQEVIARHSPRCWPSKSCSTSTTRPP